jgi:hypothetical protein
MLIQVISSFSFWSYLHPHHGHFLSLFPVFSQSLSYSSFRVHPSSLWIHILTPSSSSPLTSLHPHSRPISSGVCIKRNLTHVIVDDHIFGKGIPHFSSAYKILSSYCVLCALIKFTILFRRTKVTLNNVC